MDFDWFRFIGRAKLKYTNHETMRLTLREFKKEYQLYKDDFDLEMLLRVTRTTYEKAKQKAQQAEEWF
jgi:hypothetical protein